MEGIYEMSNTAFEIGNLVVICVTCLLIYMIPSKLSILFVIPAICFQIYVFQKYYETHKAKFEYQYAALALILFVAGYFMPKSMFNMFITFGILSLSRCGISLFAVGEKEESDKLIEQTIANTKLELQAQMQEQLRNAQAQMQNNAPLTEVEINNKVEAIRNLLVQEQTVYRAGDHTGQRKAREVGADREQDRTDEVGDSADHRAADRSVKIGCDKYRNKRKSDFKIPCIDGQKPR